MAAVVAAAAASLRMTIAKMIKSAIVVRRRNTKQGGLDSTIQVIGVIKVGTYLTYARQRGVKNEQKWRERCLVAHTH
jgi:hypothetical protein